jgi:hypothetical protein
MTKPRKNSTVRVQKIAVYRHVTPEIAYQLDNFFDFMSPDELRENLIELYHSYIIHRHGSLPNDFEKFSESMSVLLDILKSAQLKN